MATLAERLGPAGTLLGPAYPLDSTVAELRRKYPAAKYPGGIPLPLPLPLPGDLRLDRDIRDCGNKVNGCCNYTTGLLLQCFL